MDDLKEGMDLWSMMQMLVLIQIPAFTEIPGVYPELGYDF